ncbi:MAG: 6-phosphogluconolactonase [Planctomycetaceae bacterium]|nr:MAG: 6-phosphogluconolactonase [Planctomycetaceae bacterium]
MATSLKKCVEQTADQATDLVANLVKSIICDAVAQRGRCYIALAGGTTPHALYQRLAACGTGDDVPWMDVDIFFGDERDVPLDHVESNYNMVQRTMLDHLPLEPGHVHPMRGDADDLDAAATEYEQTVRDLVPHGTDGMPRFDLILLGMGGDGHTASLFPNTPAVEETKKLVTANTVPVLGRRRLTFTFPLINAARNIILLVTGDDKAEAVAGLLSTDQAVRSRYPAAKLQPTDGMLAMVFDVAASRRT